MMTARERILIDLINDPICTILMKRDGVKRSDVLTLMRSTKPLITRGRSAVPGHQGRHVYEPEPLPMRA